MSNRHRKRIGQNVEQKEIQDDNFLEDGVQSVKAGQAFSFLGVLEDEETDENCDSSVKVPSRHREFIKTPESLPKANAKKKKAKSRRRASKEDEELENLVRVIEEEPVETLMEISTSEESGQKVEDIDKINLRLLNYHYEKKKKYGKLVNNSTNTSRSRQKKSFKYSIIQPDDTWFPNQKGGFELVVDKVDSKGNTWVKFYSEKFYTDLTNAYWESVLRNDDSGAERILMEYPYHVESLIQISEVLKHQGETAMLIQCIECAVYSFEFCKNNKLVYGSNRHRFSFQVYENRLFFNVLYRHIQNISLKGFHRCALEITKLLFSFNPSEDPLGLLMILDVYYIKAAEYRMFINFVDSYPEKEQLLLLPNIVFSYALCLFLLEEKERANEYLFKALVKFPMFLKSICDACNVNFNSQLENHVFFNFYAFNLLPGVLDSLVCFYAKKSSQFWKPGEVMSWLLDQAQKMIENPSLYETSITNFKNRRKKIFKDFNRCMMRCFYFENYSHSAISSYLKSNNIIIHSVDPFPPGIHSNSFLQKHADLKRKVEVRVDPILNFIVMTLYEVYKRIEKFCLNIFRYWQ